MHDGTTDSRIATLEETIADLKRRMDELRENPALSDVDTVDALNSLNAKLTDARLDLELLHTHKQ
jgi:hypothetical protein